MHRELQEIAQVLDSLDHAAGLATVVRTAGSTYRKAGARLLMLQDRQIGSISGGCLESDVQIVAEEVLKTGQPQVLTYDLTAENEDVWGLGLGCNGTIHVLVEAVERGGLLARAIRRAARGEALALATVIGGDALQVGSHMAVLSDGATEGDLGRATPAVRDAALRALQTERSEVLSEGRAEVFVEPLLPPARLIVCGAGHDAIPLIEIASRVGFEVTVVDRREALLTHDRFPSAAGFVRTDFPQAASAVRPDARTYIVIMTHHFTHDRDLLAAFLPSDARYIGMLGPRERTERLLRALRKDGAGFTEDQLGRLHGPVGLDLGSEGPEEIAVAIVAEVAAVRRGGTAGFLRDRAWAPSAATG